MSMAHRNIVAGLSLLVFACWYAYLAGNLPERDVMPNTPGPAFFPTIIVASVLVLSLALVVSGWRGLQPEASAKMAEFASRDGAYAIGAFLVYLAVLPYAGFIVASIPFFAVLMFLYGTRSPAVIGAVAVIMPLILYTVFRHGFQIVLPRGILAF